MDDRVTKILEDRSKTHGPFRENAHICMTFRSQARAAPGWGVMSEVRQLALDEILLKVARALSTGTNEVGLTEAFDDIAGYAILARDNA